MTSRIIVGEARSESGGGGVPGNVMVWRLLAVTGFMLCLVALADLGLGLYPLSFGNLQWEFGAVSQMFDSLPLLTMSSTLLVGGLAGLGRTAGMKVVASFLVAFGVFLVASLVVYALTVPLALKAVTDPLALSGLKKAIVKTAVQGVVFPTVFFWLGYNGFRRVKQQ